MTHINSAVMTVVKKHGIKLALPLLLLTTACDDPGNNGPLNFDSLDLSELDADGADADSSAFDGLVNMNGGNATSVPEPATMIGLGASAVGLVLLKRRRQG